MPVNPLPFAFQNYGSLLQPLRTPNSERYGGFAFDSEIGWAESAEAKTTTDVFSHVAFLIDSPNGFGYCPSLD